MEVQLKLTFKNPNIPSLSWIGKKLSSPTRATLTNLRPTFKNHNFEFKDELKMLCPNLCFTVEN